jgi:hypothetical protein
LYEHVKDNRLLPIGWTKEGRDFFEQLPATDEGLTPAQKKTFVPRTDFIEATQPQGRAARDDNFTNGMGSDVIRYKIRLPNDVSASDQVNITATLYYQAIPPIYLDQRFLSGNGKLQNVNTARLKYLTDNLKVEKTSIDDWKLKIQSDTEKL